MNPESDLPQPEELNELLPADAYRVEGLLAKGGMGAVYQGVQLRLHRPVAIKILRRGQGRDLGFEQRFQREAHAMAALNHPNIVSVIDCGEAGPDYLYIVMELVDGADLMEVIRTGRMTQEVALALLPQICDALQFAHDHGIVHRDIKPGNIMLTRDGRVKIADFGLAKRHETESAFHTQQGIGMGTPAYAAPEQLVAEGRIDHRADIYALGVMIYQMITGELPRGSWKPPSLRTGCDPHWDDIVSQAMESDPRDRYQQASEVKTDVSRIGAGSSDPVAGAPDPGGGSNGTSGPLSASSRPASRKRFGPPVLAVTIGSIALAAGVFFSLRHFGAPGQSAPPAQGIPDGDTHRFGGHRYRFVPGAMKWDEARAKAEAMGGHLATVTSREENEWIYATFGPKLDPEKHSSSVWLGGSADAAGHAWSWVTGEPFAFADWFEGEPDYSSTTGQPVNGPFGICIKSRGTFHWFDDPVKRGNASAGFLVEWDDDGTGNENPKIPGYQSGPVRQDSKYAILSHSPTGPAGRPKHPRP